LQASIIGSGNVATQLGLALLQSNIAVKEVWSRNYQHAKRLSSTLKSNHLDALNKLDDNIDFCFICVKDDAIANIVAQLHFQQALVVHTSGSTSLKLLANCSTHIGVLYPVQTFSQTQYVSCKSIPLAIGANSSEALDLLRSVAEKLSTTILTLNSEQRKQLHLAAVIASNFSNYMYAMAEQLLKNHQIPFDVLKPLILETAQKIQSSSPLQTQTGPAIRGDVNIIAQHLAMLKDAPHTQLLYQMISERISNSSY